MKNLLFLAFILALASCGTATEPNTPCTTDSIVPVEVTHRYRGPVYEHEGRVYAADRQDTVKVPCN